jgi:hypothetical protein
MYIQRFCEVCSYLKFYTEIKLFFLKIFTFCTAVSINIFLHIFNVIYGKALKMILSTLSNCHSCAD